MEELCQGYRATATPGSRPVIAFEAGFTGWWSVKIPRPHVPGTIFKIIGMQNGWVRCL